MVGLDELVPGWRLSEGQGQLTHQISQAVLAQEINGGGDIYPVVDRGLCCRRTTGLILWDGRRRGCTRARWRRSHRDRCGFLRGGDMVPHCGLCPHPLVLVQLCRGALGPVLPPAGGIAATVFLLLSCRPRGGLQGAPVPFWEEWHRTVLLPVVLLAWAYKLHSRQLDMYCDNFLWTLLRLLCSKRWSPF